jgi:replicative DNA helicase
MLACLSGVPFKTVKGGLYGTHALRARVDKAKQQLREFPMQLCGDRSLGVECIVDRVAQMITQAGSEIIYIDQLSFIKGPGKSERERFDAVVRELKDLAEQMQVVIVLLCQLNREGENTGTTAKPPRMENLYGCDGIAQTADIILCPWYPNAQRDCPEITINGQVTNVENKIILRCIVDRCGEGWAEMMDFDGSTSCLNRVRA